MQSADSTLAATMSSYQVSDATYGERIDELVQQNELILKENDLLVSFIERHQHLLAPAAPAAAAADADLDLDMNMETLAPEGVDALEAPGAPGAGGAEDAENTGAGAGADATLTMQELVLVAIAESEDLKSDCELVRAKGAEVTMTLKALTLSAETKLSELRRWLFVFRRDVLQDPQAAVTGGSIVRVGVTAQNEVVASPSPSPRGRSRSPSRSPARTSSPSRSPPRRSPSPHRAGGVPGSRSPSPAALGAPTPQAVQAVQAREFTIPEHVSSARAQAFYTDVFAQLRQSIGNLTARVQANTRAIRRIGADARGRATGGDQATSVDFDQLAIANGRYLERIAAKNQELLRLKLTAGNTVLVLNTLKSELGKLTEERRFVEREIGLKRAVIDKLAAQIEETKAALGQDRGVLKRLRQNEIAAGDGPFSIDYISLKATEGSLAKALREYERKVAIMERTLANLTRDIAVGQRILGDKLQ